MKSREVYLMLIVQFHHGPLARYVKLRVAHAPGMFSPPPRVSDPDMHHGTYVTHVPWCMPGLLTSGFFWSRWRGKRSRHSRRMRKPQFYVSGRRPIELRWLGHGLAFAIMRVFCFRNGRQDFNINDCAGVFVKNYVSCIFCERNRGRFKCPLFLLQ